MYLLSPFSKVPHLKKFSINLDKLIKDPFSQESEEDRKVSLMSRTTDIFGNELPTDDEILNLLRQEEADDALKTCMGPLLKGFKKVCTNQLAPYISGEFSDVSQDVLDKTRAASPHNIFAERTLGMLDSLYRHRKQATVEYLASKVYFLFPLYF